MKKQHALALVFFGLISLVSNLAVAASVSVTVSGNIGPEPILNNSAERLQYFGVQLNDPFAISFTYDDQQALGAADTPVQNYTATLGSTAYVFTNPSQIAANGAQHALTNMNNYRGKSGVEDLAGFSNAQANFDLRLLGSAATDVRNFDASQAPLTLTAAMFDPSYISTLFFGASNNAASQGASSISGFISSLSLSATPELSAVPVPAALWLFTTGLIAVFGLKRRAAATR